MKTTKRLLVPCVLWSIAALGLVANSWLVSAATHGNGMSSDAGYYERALQWDGFMAASATATRLGISVVPTLHSGEQGAAELCVTMTGGDGLIRDATQVRADASANLCPKRGVETALEQRGDAYCAPVAEACAGVWIVHVTATVNGQRIAASTRAELGSAR